MIWLIGVGAIGIEYAKVLDALNIEYIAIGRGELSALKFEQTTGHAVVRGGLHSFLKDAPKKPDAAIVAVGIESLTSTCIALLQYGVKDILQEKPGIGWIHEIDEIVAQAEDNSANVMLAYNRRFYSSVYKAEELIRKDGGVSSFTFEFTEWSHVVASLQRPQVVLNTWFMGNSSHVIDTAFFLGGFPSKISVFHSGENLQTWHPSGSIYGGAGISDIGAIFSYHANWNAPGRWSVEILTTKHRYYLKPMETLQVQDIGSMAINPVDFDNSLDIAYKPGFYLQTKAFIEKDYSRFCTIQMQKKHIEDVYIKMSGY